MKSFSSSLVLGAPAIAALLVASACGDSSGETGAGGSTSSGSNSATTASSSPTTGTGDGGSGAGTTGGEGGDGPGPGPTSSSGQGAGGSGEGGQVLPGDYDCSAPDGALGNLAPQPFLEIPGQPMQLRQAPGDTDRFFIVHKGGVIFVAHDGVLNAAPFLDISGLVQDDGEQGLLGLTFHNDYQTNGRFFVHYTSPETFVAEYQVSKGDPDVANPEAVGRVMQVPAYQSNHNGGAVEFGPDGFLYASVGDGGEQGDPNCRAQDLTLRAGKILRANVATPGTYSGAANNFPGADPFVYDIGFRNPWRMTFDPCTGDLWIADVGQNQYEEVTVHPAGAGPLNHGWNTREGAHDYPTDCDLATPNPTEPVLDYPHGEGNSITGGFVYRGTEIPALRGAYLFGDFGSGSVWSTRWAPGDAIPAAKTEHPTLAQGGNSIAAFGQDNQGEVYILHIGGDIYKVVQE